MFWLIVYHLLRSPVGPAPSTCDPQTPAGHGPVRPHTVTSVRGSDDMDSVDTNVTTDEQVTRQDIIDALLHHTETAQTIRRQGYTGIYGQTYARIHAHIDGLLYDLAALDLDDSLVLEG